MTGPSDLPPPSEPDALDQLAKAAAGGLTRRQLVKLGGAVALSALIPRWSAPARAAGLAPEFVAKKTGPCPPQKRGTCGGVRMEWTPDCKQRVANGQRSEFNGCGPQAGLDLPGLGHGDWVPDRPLYVANFFDACKGHDCCYGTCGSKKSTCDNDFLKNMFVACAEVPSDVFFQGISIANCYMVAGIYHAAVSDTQTGQDAYNAGQKEVCDCCTEYRVDFVSTLRLAVPGGAFNYKLVAKVPVKLGDDGKITGSAPLTYASADGQVCGDSGVCTGIVGTSPSTLTVTSASPGTSNWIIFLDPGTPTETYAGGVRDSTQHLWLDAWEGCHRDELSTGFGSPVVSQGDTVASQVFTTTCAVGGAAINDTTTISVVQTTPPS